ncbi:MAG: ABC transporter permease [Lachnospiraceae bacterium]|nr:ABC transporter permease [Lachnospiraceae bacterium]
MNAIKTIYNKEMRRVLFDKKMVFGLFVMPVLLMIFIYGIMALMMFMMYQDIEKHVSQVYVYGAPDEFMAMLNESEEDITVNEVGDLDQLADLKDMIVQGDADYIIEFPDGFIDSIANYKDGDSVPQVKTYYNPSEEYSESAESICKKIIEDYRVKLLKERVGSLDTIQIFTVNADNKEAKLQDDSKAGGKMLGMFLPYMISLLLFAGVMSLGTDTIAGEKERGTLATMLVLPIKRSQIVYGKLLALMTLSAMSACVYGGGMLVSIPLLALFMSVSGMKFTITVIQAVLLIVLIISMVFVYVAIVALLSVFAKDMKEAGTYITPAYLVVIVAGMMTMFRTSEANTFEYLIPLYGPCIAMRNILTQEISNGQLILSILMNIFVGVILAFIVTKAFDNERVMLNA